MNALRSLLALPGMRILVTLVGIGVAWFGWVMLNDAVDTVWNLRLSYGAVYATVLVGLVVLVGHSGQVTLGHGAFMAVGGYTFVLLTTNWLWHPVFSTIAAAFMGLVVGLIIGAVAARLSGPYLAGVTLAIAAGLPALASRFPDLLGGEPGLFVDVFPPESFGFEFPFERWGAWIAGAIAIVTIAIVGLLVSSSIGRDIRAVRDNEAAAALSGIPVARTKIIAFTISTTTAALGGAGFAQVLTIVAPGAFGIGLSLSLLVGIILGGRTWILGAVIGGAILVGLEEITSLMESAGLAPEVALSASDLLYGLLLLLAVAFAPRGLAGLLSRR